MRGSSALMLLGELCIATGACPNGGVMGSTSGTTTGYEIVNRAILVHMRVVLFAWGLVVFPCVLLVCSDCDFISFYSAGTRVFVLLGL